MKLPGILSRPPRMSSMLALSAPIFFAVLLAVGFVHGTLEADEQSQKTLYERLGGVATIAPMMDDLLDRLYVNPVINANPAVQAIHLRLHPAVAKFMFTEYFCQASGGPCRYVGRSMREAHSGLNITEAEWKAMQAEFQKTLNKLKVPERERKELGAIVNYTKADIVVVNSSGR